MNIYELHGRLIEQHSEEQRNHLLSLDLLGKLVRGEIDMSRVTMTENGWKLTPVAATPTAGAEGS